MINLLFLPGDLTQLKSTIRRIMQDLQSVGYQSSQSISQYELIDRIAKIVTTAVALKKINLDDK